MDLHVVWHELIGSITREVIKLGVGVIEHRFKFFWVFLIRVWLCPLERLPEILEVEPISEQLTLDSSSLINLQSLSSWKLLDNFLLSIFASKFDLFALIRCRWTGSKIAEAHVDKVFVVLEDEMETVRQRWSYFGKLCHSLTLYIFSLISLLSWNICTHSSLFEQTHI